jgi:hypothetical protein
LHLLDRGAGPGGYLYVRPVSRDGHLSPTMDTHACFLPGLIALGHRHDAPESGVTQEELQRACTYTSAESVSRGGMEEEGQEEGWVSSWWRRRDQDSDATALPPELCGLPPADRRFLAVPDMDLARELMRTCRALHVTPTVRALGGKPSSQNS